MGLCHASGLDLSAAPAKLAAHASCCNLCGRKLTDIPLKESLLHNFGAVAMLQHRLGFDTLIASQPPVEELISHATSQQP
jgi:hypothetical protein